MSQHDYVLSNASGAALRADLNLALAAIVSLNSGATEPATPYAHMLWVDTTAGKVKQRNAANDAWIIIGDLGAEYWGMATESYVDAIETALAAAYAAADAAHVAAADPHDGYLKHALATAVNDFFVASGAGVIVKRTLAETQAILGIAGQSCLENYLTSNLALTLSDTFYHGPSLALTPGTWKLEGAVSLFNDSAGNRNFTIKLWNGTTVKSSGPARLSANGLVVVPVGGIVEVVALTTWKISVAATGADCLVLATPPDNNTGCANTASYLTATKIA